MCNPVYQGLRRAKAFYLSFHFHGDALQEPVNELRVSALGGALDVAVQVATRMERDGIGVSAEVKQGPEMGNPWGTHGEPMGNPWGTPSYQMLSGY